MFILQEITVYVAEDNCLYRRREWFILQERDVHIAGDDLLSGGVVAAMGVSGLSTTGLHVSQF